MYEIITITDKNEIERGNVAQINVYNWGGDYQPKAYARLCYVKEQGFAVRLCCEEKNPLATYTELNSMVCEDSCLEFFANYKPEISDKGYLSFEANSIGTLLGEYGSEGDRRSCLSELGLPYPTIKPFRNETEWGYDMFIPLELIQLVYGNSEYQTGDRIKGNFFKCGDKTACPHYGSYTKIDWAYPSFHRPQFFADMVIVSEN